MADVTPEQIASLKSAVEKLVADEDTAQTATGARQAASAAADAANEAFHASEKTELDARADVRSDTLSVLTIAGQLAGVSIVVADDGTVSVTPLP